MGPRAGAPCVVVLLPAPQAAEEVAASFAAGILDLLPVVVCDLADRDALQHLPGIHAKPLLTTPRTLRVPRLAAGSRGARPRRASRDPVELARAAASMTTAGRNGLSGDTTQCPLPRQGPLCPFRTASPRVRLLISAGGSRGCAPAARLPGQAQEETVRFSRTPPTATSLTGPNRLRGRLLIPVALLLALSSCTATPSSDRAVTKHPAAATATATATAGSRPYSSTSFVLPFDVALPSWVVPGVKEEQRDFVTWDGAKGTALRVMHPVEVYSPAGGAPFAA